METAIPLWSNSKTWGLFGDFYRKATASLVITFIVTICYTGFAVISSCRIFSIYYVPIADSSLDEAIFAKSMHMNWGGQNAAFLGSGDDVALVLDQNSGSGTRSKNSYLFGSFEVLIKLVPGNSAGTVVAFYLSSTGNTDKQDEIDFEFLGNVTGEPYTIHTNIFIQGGGGKEQQFYPWFDPTADYHNYTIHWNPSHIVWYVDSIPIRVYRNHESKGIPYPKNQPMRVYSSIWNADSWATQGGNVKIDWRESPFISRLRHFRARGCQFDDTANISQCAEPSQSHWWSAPEYSQLSLAKHEDLNSTRDKYMIYDYCKDHKLYKVWFPGDCYVPQY